MKPIWQDARDAHQALRTELAKATPDEGALSKLEDRLSSDRQQMMSLQQQKQAELRKELSPTQYAKLMQSRMGRFGRHMHGGKRGNGGATAAASTAVATRNKAIGEQRARLLRCAHENRRAVGARAARRRLSRSRCTLHHPRVAGDGDAGRAAQAAHLHALQVRPAHRRGARDARRRSADGRTVVKTTFTFNDRGTDVPLAAEWVLAPDGRPRLYQAWGFVARGTPVRRFGARRRRRQGRDRAPGGADAPGAGAGRVRRRRRATRQSSARSCWRRRGSRTGGRRTWPSCPTGTCSSQSRGFDDAHRRRQGAPLRARGRLRARLGARGSVARRHRRARRARHARRRVRPLRGDASAGSSRCSTSSCAAPATTRSPGSPKPRAAPAPPAGRSPSSAPASSTAAARRRSRTPPSSSTAIASSPPGRARRPRCRPAPASSTARAPPSCPGCGTCTRTSSRSSRPPPISPPASPPCATRATSCPSSPACATPSKPGAASARA